MHTVHRHILHNNSAIVFTFLMCAVFLLSCQKEYENPFFVYVFVSFISAHDPVQSESQGGGE